MSSPIPGYIFDKIISSLGYIICAILCRIIVSLLFRFVRVHVELLRGDGDSAVQADAQTADQHLHHQSERHRRHGGYVSILHDAV